MGETWDNMNGHNGLAWKDDDFKVIVIHTPKCASTTIRQHITHGGPMNLNTDDVPDYKLLTVMRNPITRFWSGVTTAMHSPSEVLFYNHINFKEGTWKERIMYVLNEVNHGRYFDIHIIPQVWFHHDRLSVPFQIDDYLKFEDFTKEVQRTISDGLYPVNANGNPIHEVGITSLYDDPEVLAEIRVAYAADFECYKNNIGETI